MWALGPVGPRSTAAASVSWRKDASGSWSMTIPYTARWRLRKRGWKRRRLGVRSVVIRVGTVVVKGRRKGRGWRVFMQTTEMGMEMERPAYVGRAF